MDEMVAMRDLQRLLARQDFKSDKEVQDFISQFQNKPIPKISKEELRPDELSEDMVLEAYELPKSEGRAKAKEALAIYPDCILAYLYLGMLCNDTEKGVKYFKKGSAIGRKFFIELDIDSEKNNIWSYKEAEPFLKCLISYAACLWAMDDPCGAVKLLEEVVRFDPEDMLNAKGALMVYLLETRGFIKFKKYAKQFKSEDSAIWDYNAALFDFIMEGESLKARKKIKLAVHSNFIIADILLSREIISQLSGFRPGSIGELAEYYVMMAQRLWQTTDGAMEWLRKNAR